MSVSIDHWEIAVDPMTAEDVVDWIRSELPSGKRLILNHNLHSVYLYLKHSEFAEIYSRSDMTLVDGFPVLMAVNRSRKLKGMRKLDSSYRCGSTDWLMRLGDLPVGTRIALVGGSEESNIKAVEILREKFPSIVFEGWNGYGDAQYLVKSEFSDISKFKPNVVVVGMGMPYQERYLASNWEVLPDGIYATVGGAIDQISGFQNLAPRWLGRLRLEWAWRLFSNPVRLSHRYLVEPVKLLFMTLGMRRF